MGSYDYHIRPDKLYYAWIESDCVEEADIGICFPVGLLVASYMFESKEVSGQMVYCRNKWEFRGDASESTRITLDVDSDPDKWKVYIQSGYEEYEM